MAVVKGFSRGLIVAIFSLGAFIIGLAAALKLSAVVAGHLQNSFQVSGKWLAVVSFLLVFALVVFAVQWMAQVIKKMASIVLLGWLDKLGGIILYAVIYLLIYSVILFYASQLRLIAADTAEKSSTFSFIQPWGPRVINGLGSIIPIFRNVFSDLTRFFSGVAGTVK